ncbi:uncharacterized protein LOC144455348 [Phascolarctos cinereus]
MSGAEAWESCWECAGLDGPARVRRPGVGGAVGSRCLGGLGSSTGRLGFLPCTSPRGGMSLCFSPVTWMLSLRRSQCLFWCRCGPARAAPWGSRGARALQTRDSGAASPPPAAPLSAGSERRVDGGDRGRRDRPPSSEPRPPRRRFPAARSPHAARRGFWQPPPPPLQLPRPAPCSPRRSLSAGGGWESGTRR